MLNRNMIMTGSNVVRRGRLKYLDRQDVQEKTRWVCVMDDVEI